MDDAGSDKRPLRLVRNRRTVCEIPRQRVGRTRHRRQDAVRISGAGERPGRIELDNDPPQARRVSQGFLRFRRRTGGPNDRRRCRTADAHGRHREKPAENQGRDHERTAVPPSAKGVRELLRLHAVILSRPEADRQLVPVAERNSGVVARVRRHEQGHEKTGIQILRQHDLLRPPAGGRIYRRSPDGLHLPKKINFFQLTVSHGNAKYIEEQHNSQNIFV